jgi:hypothetical protein
MSLDKDKAFWKYMEDRYKGKVWRIERSTHVDPTKESLIVRVEFHLPASEVDEIEVYRRINKVIHVIAEGDDDT